MTGHPRQTVFLMPNASFPSVDAPCQARENVGAVVGVLASREFIFDQSATAALACRHGMGVLHDDDVGGVTDRVGMDGAPPALFEIWDRDRLTVWDESRCISPTITSINFYIWLTDINIG
jgi:hypothetical protein